MTSYPPVQSVVRAVAILKQLNLRRVTTIDQLHRTTGLPKPTIVRLLETLISEGLAVSDKRLGGYCVSSMVATLSAGFHGSPLVVEAARPWCLDMTRRLKWPVSIAVLDGAAVSVRFSTIPDSPMSPFHATINMRLSLISRALGRAYLAFCPDEERKILVRLLASSPDPEDHPPDIEMTVQCITRRVRQFGFAERDPNVEPKSSSTIAVPIRTGDRVLATLGVTFFRSAMKQPDHRRALVGALKETASRIEESVAAMTSGSDGLADIAAEAPADGRRVSAP